MANATTAQRRGFNTQTIVAYAIGYALAAVAIVVGLILPATAWVILGLWLAASVTVLLVDRAVGERTPRPGHPEEGFGAIFQASPVALIIIALLAAVAVLVAVLLGR